MKRYFELVIHGDSDVIVNNEIHEDERYYFQSFDRKKMVEVLNRIHDVVPAGVNKNSCVSYFKNAIYDMKTYIQHVKEPSSEYESIFKEFGSNQYVRLETQYMPTEEDWE